MSQLINTILSEDFKHRLTDAAKVHISKHVETGFQVFKEKKSSPQVDSVVTGNKSNITLNWAPSKDLDMHNNYDSIIKSSLPPPVLTLYSLFISLHFHPLMTNGSLYCSNLLPSTFIDGTGDLIFLHRTREFPENNYAVKMIAGVICEEPLEIAVLAVQEKESDLKKSIINEQFLRNLRVQYKKTFANEDVSRPILERCLKNIAFLETTGEYHAEVFFMKHNSFQGYEDISRFKENKEIEK